LFQDLIHVKFCVCCGVVVVVVLWRDVPVESKIGTAETEMDEGKPAAVMARDSETDSEQRAEPDVMDKM
jgi:hypothetical protein